MAKTKLQTSMEELEEILKTLGPDEDYNPAFGKEVMELAEATIKLGQSAKKRVQSLLAKHHHATTKHLFALEGKDTGTVSQHFGPLHTLKINIKKKVEWDQGHLENLQKIDPEAAPYINAKFSIKETEYDKAAPMVKDKLDGGRTVTASEPTFSIEER